MLFYHLNVVPLEIPPLKKHAYDIPLLVDHYKQKHNKDLSRSVKMSTAALRHLRNYPWPGNISELVHVIKRLVSLAPSDDAILEPQDLITLLGEKQAHVVPEQTFRFFSSLKEATSSFEKNFLLYLLKINHYNLEQVCDHLHMDKTQLQNKLLELNIQAGKG